MSKKSQINKKFDIGNIATVFRILLDKASFTVDGMFLLKLTINSTNSNDKSGVRLRSKNSEKFINDYSVKSEIIGPVNKDISSNFEFGEYSFYLPKGFCRNHINYDIYVLIETVQVLENSKTKVIGSVKIPIYPRTDVIENHNVEIGDPIYQFKGSVLFMRLETSNLKDLHCGELFYQSELSEIREIIEKPIEFTAKPKPQTPVKKIVAQPKENNNKKRIIEVSSSTNEVFINESKEHYSNSNKGEIIEFGMPPLPYNEIPIQKDKIFPPKDIHDKSNIYHLLSSKGREEISVFVRYGEYLFGNKGKVTNLYVSCSFKTNNKLYKNTYDSTHVTPQPTSTPYWEEILNLSLEREMLKTELFVSVIDHNSKEKVIDYILPLKTLTPFLQHHLKLCKESISEKLQSILYITIIRKLDHYPLTGNDIKFSAFIIKPLKFLFPREINFNVPLICFCYLSNDPLKFRKIINPIEDNIITMKFPSPSNFDYVNSKKLPMMSAGQLSIPSFINNGVDTFNFPFLFCQPTELDTSFTPHSFIILDFYEIPLVNNMNWRYNSPVIRSTLKLDKFLYRQLDSQEIPCINQYKIEFYKFFQNHDEIRTKTKESNNEDKIFIKLFLINQNISDSISPENIPDNSSEMPLFEDVPVKPKSPEKLVEEIIKKEPFLYEIKPVKDSNYSEILNIDDNLPMDTAVDEMIARFLHDGNPDIIPIREKRIKLKPTDKFKESMKGMQLELVNLKNQVKQLTNENRNLEAKLNYEKPYSNIEGNKLEYLESLSRGDLFKEYDDLRRKFGARLSVTDNYKKKEETLTQALNTHKNKKSPADLIENLQRKIKYVKILECEVLKRENIILNLEQKLYGKKSQTENQNIKINSSRKIEEKESDDNERNILYNQLKKAENRIENLQNELMEIAKKRGANRQMKKIKEAEMFYR